MTTPATMIPRSKTIYNQKILYQPQQNWRKNYTTERTNLLIMTTSANPAILLFTDGVESWPLSLPPVDAGALA